MSPRVEPLSCKGLERLVSFLKGRSTRELEGIAMGLMFLDILKRRGIEDKNVLKRKLITLVESRRPFLSDIVGEIADTVVSNFA